MEKDRSSKIIALVALLLSVIGLSLGFAAFSNTITIESKARVTVDPDEFKVVFSKVSDDVESGAIASENIILTNGATVETDPAEAAAVDGSTTRVVNLNAVFTKPGQSVKYKFYARNTGEYLAYLREVKFNTISGETVAKKCTPAVAVDGATPALVANACESISVSVKIGGTEVTTTNEGISGHSLAKNTSELVEVTISYAEGGARADGDFYVQFGTIDLTYKTVDAS